MSPLPVAGARGPGGPEGAGDRQVQPLHLAPCSGPCARAATLFLLPGFLISPPPVTAPCTLTLPLLPPDLLRPSQSPAGPQCPPPFFALFLPVPHQPPPPSGGLSYVTAAPPNLTPHPAPLLPDPWLPVRSPPLRQRQAGVGPGFGAEPHSCPLPSPFCII